LLNASVGAFALSSGAKLPDCGARCRVAGETLLTGEYCSSLCYQATPPAAAAAAAAAANTGILQVCLAAMPVWSRFDATQWTQYGAYPRER